MVIVQISFTSSWPRCLKISREKVGYDFVIAQDIYIYRERAFALLPQGSTQQKPWRPCWCSRQKSPIKILLNWNTNMVAVTSCANALYSNIRICRWKFRVHGNGIFVHLLDLTRAVIGPLAGIEPVTCIQGIF